MASAIVINGNSYNGVPFIKSPKVSGGDAIFYDTSDANATSSAHILSGYSAYGASGKIDGGVTMPTITQDSQTGGLTIS